MTDGIKEITVIAYDKAGNRAAGKVSAYIDSRPPSGLKLAINNKAERTNSTMVSLAIECADDASGVSMMALSNDGVNYQPWETYCTTKSWELSEGNGQKTVFLKIRDKAGNEATPIKASIEFKADTSNPLIGENSILPLMAIPVIIIAVIVISVIIWKKRKKS